MKQAAKEAGNIITDSLQTQEEYRYEFSKTFENNMENMRVDFAIGVNGDSMEPTYRDGDTLLIKKQSDINIGEIGIFMINGEAFVKELGDGVLISHNKKYKDIHINDSVICLGKVISKHIS